MEGNRATRITKRQFLTLLAAGAASASLAACTQAATTPTAAPTSAPAATTAPQPTSAAATSAANRPTTAASSVTAPTVATSAETPRDGGTLKISMGSTLDTNTFSSTTIPPMEEYVGARLASTAWTLDKQVPDLAESWEVLDGGRAYVFKLRKNVTWHDGQPLTAEDVEWTFTTGLNPDSASWMGNQLNDIVGYDDIRAGKTDKVSGIKVIDPYTIRFDVIDPNATWLMRQSVLNILPKHKLASIAPKDLAKDAFWNDVHTMAGPYKWVKYAPQQSLQLARHDAYYLGKPHMDQVIFLPFANADASLIAMEKGDIDSVQIPITELARFQKLPQLDVIPLKGGVANWISVNTSKPEFADKRFRQAVAYAIDKDKIIQTLWTGLAAPLYGHFLQDWAKNPNVNKYAYNPDKAKQLLKDVNWDPNRVIDFTYYYADKQSESLMVAMQSYLEQVGVKTKIRLIDTATVTKEVDKDGTYDWMYGALGVPLDPDQATAGVASDRLYPAGQNRPKWKNPALDAEMKAGRASLDQSERQKHYYEAERILNEELPYIWLWEPQRPQAVSKRATGMAQHQGLVYNMSAYRAIQDWWIKA